MKISIYILILLSAFSCKTPPMAQTGNSHPDSVFVSLERSPCFGRCPVFSAVIYNNGKAVYEGRSSVVRQGYFTGTATAAQMEHISAEAVRLRLDTLQNEYVNPRLADFPSHRFSVLINGEKKQVYIMHTEPPSSIAVFEQLLEAELEKISWVKQESGE